MYFIPQRHAWYRAVAHINPIIRYAFTIGVMVLLAGGWRFGLYPVMTALIAQDYAERTQLEQQAMRYAHSEKTCSDLSCTMQKLKATLAHYQKNCSGDFCSTQLTNVLDHAAKSGIHVSSYANQKEIKKSWCTCHDVQIGFSASLDATVSFLQKLAQAHAMIECNQITCNSAQNGVFNTTCALRFISL